MNSCLAATGPLPIEPLIVVALVLLAAGLVIARRAQSLTARGSLALLPLLLAALVLSAAPAAPAFAIAQDCPPASMPTSPPVAGDECAVATERAATLSGVFREPTAPAGEEEPPPFTQARFTETEGEQLVGLIDDVAAAGLSYVSTATLAFGDLTVDREVSLEFDAQGAYIDLEASADDPLPRRVEATMSVDVVVIIPAAEGCEESTLTLTLQGFLIEDGRDFTPIDPCETDQRTAIDLAGSWIQQQGSDSLSNALLVGFMSYTNGGPEDGADLVERGTLTSGFITLTLSDGTTQTRPATLVSYFTPAGEVQLGADVSTPDGTRVTAIEAVFTYTVPGLPDCDPTLVFLTFAGPANLDVINT